jgi:recombination protein RecA
MKEKKAKVQESDLNSIVEGMEDYVASPAGPRKFLHTGNLALDYAISMKVDGTGGYPFGTIVELFGDPSAGKSLLLAKAVAEAQKSGNLAIVMDAEGRWDDDFAATQGVDAEKRKLFQPDTVEEFAVSAHKILSNLKDKSAVMVLDSIAILSTLAETDDVEEGDLKMDQGRKAQKIKQALRVLKSDIKHSNSILIAANHVIANPGSYSHQKVTPGGGGFPFQSSVRIELLNPTPIKLEGKNRPIGVQLHTKVTKNSVAPPFGVANINLYWARGVDKFSGLIDILKDQEVITLSGAWYSWGEKKFQSKDFEEFVRKNPGILEDPKLTKPYFME